MNCNLYTPYCLKCNNSMHKILESKFFKCTYCACLTQVRDTQIVNLSEEIRNNQNLYYSKNSINYTNISSDSLAKQSYSYVMQKELYNALKYSILKVYLR